MMLSQYNSLVSEMQYWKDSYITYLLPGSFPWNFELHSNLYEDRRYGVTRDAGAQRWRPLNEAGGLLPYAPAPEV